MSFRILLFRFRATPSESNGNGRMITPAPSRCTIQGALNFDASLRPINRVFKLTVSTASPFRPIRSGVVPLMDLVIPTHRHLIRPTSVEDISPPATLVVTVDSEENLVAQPIVNVAAVTPNPPSSAIETSAEFFADVFQLILTTTERAKRASAPTMHILATQDSPLIDATLRSTIVSAIAASAEAQHLVEAENREALRKKQDEFVKELDQWFKDQEAMNDIDSEIAEIFGPNSGNL